jgi:transposase
MRNTIPYAEILGIKPPWLITNVEVSHPEQSVRIFIALDESVRPQCPECSKPGNRYGTNRREWRHLDTCQYQTVLVGDIPRVECPEHGVRQISVPWAGDGSRYTVLFESLAIDWLMDAPTSAVADHMRLGWDAVDGIKSRAVARGLARRETVVPVNVCIDETSHKKGHNYLTVIGDRDTGAVHHVAIDRKEEGVNEYWESVPPAERARVQSVTMDFWKAFIGSTQRYIPDAEQRICFDRFHVAGYFGDAMDDVRKEEHRRLMKEGDETLKGSRYEWMRNNRKMDNRSRHWFVALAHSTLKTARAWAMKELASQLWDYQQMGRVTQGWKRLLTWMRKSRLAPMIELAETIQSHLWGILNAIRLRASNGNAEGINSRIQKLKKIACGFRSPERFRIDILFHLGKLNLYPGLPT